MNLHPIELNALIVAVQAAAVEAPGRDGLQLRLGSDVYCQIGIMYWPLKDILGKLRAMLKECDTGEKYWSYKSDEPGTGELQ